MRLSGSFFKFQRAPGYIGSWVSMKRELIAKPSSERALPLSDWRRRGVALGFPITAGPVDGKLVQYCPLRFINITRRVDVQAGFDSVNLPRIPVSRPQS